MVETSPNQDFAIRRATLDDLHHLVELRVAMFEAMGHEKETLIQAIDPMRDYFEKHLPTGAFRVWVAERSGVAIASIGVVIHSIPPSPHNMSGTEAYIMNLVTLPKYRRRGIAGKLMLHVLDKVRSEGVSLASLHASSEGRQMYEQLGFSISDAVPEMRLLL
jgi:GNAT superfamily N-acetyltransferase